MADNNLLDPWREETKAEEAAPPPPPEAPEDRSKLKVPFIGTSAGITVWTTDSVEDAANLLCDIIENAFSKGLDGERWGIFRLRDSGALPLYFSLSNRIIVALEEGADQASGKNTAIHRLSGFLREAKRRGINISPVTAYTL